MLYGKSDEMLLPGLGMLPKTTPWQTRKRDYTADLGGASCHAVNCLWIGPYDK